MRYAIIGTGNRSQMYYQALTNDQVISKQHHLVALMDVNQSRMDLVNQELALTLPTYRPHQFDQMIKKEQIKGLVITTKDSCHHEYIIKGLKQGLKVITEKPMTTTSENCQKILDVIKQTGNDLIVTFNYRYSPYRAKVKELIQNGTIGEITLVEFHWFLDTTHGADYYRRWHRNKSDSGSLLVHKSTHHFDLVNWWLDSVPEQVFALGEKQFYRPDTFQYRLRCATCDVTAQCDFYLDLSSSANLTARYKEAEGEDGYFRDRCVFSPDTDIWDTRVVSVGYRNSAMLSYSLNNYAPYEGYKLALVGTKGRIEQDVIEASYINGHDGKLVRRTAGNNVRLEVYPLFGQSYQVALEGSAGGHGGGDIRLLRDIFLEPGEDPLDRKAGGLDGAISILTGIAARLSIEQGKKINIADLVDFK